MNNNIINSPSEMKRREYWIFVKYLFVDEDSPAKSMGHSRVSTVP